MTRFSPTPLPLPDTFSRILALEQQRQALYAELGEYADEERRLKLRSLEAALADLWATRRQERAISRVRPRPQTNPKKKQKRPGR